MNLRFLLWVALRYFRSRRRERRTSSPVFSVIGITAGIGTLTAVLAVMNGFQLSFIEPILEVKGYHMQIEGVASDRLDLLSLPGVSLVVPYIDIQTIAGTNRPCVLRAAPPELLEADAGFLRSFRDTHDRPSTRLLDTPGNVVVGSQLAARLGLTVGDELTLFAFSASSFSQLSPTERTLRVSGIFKTGYYEIDLNWAFVSLTTASLFGDQIEPILGLKLSSPNADRELVPYLRDLLPTATRVESWRDYNRVFFNALKTEKALMMLLVGLIFVVVGFNIFHSLRRTVYERIDEIGTLKALGAPAATIRRVFIAEGFLIGTLGDFFGTMAGLLIAANVNTLFRGAERMVNRGVIPLLEWIIRPFVRDVFLPGISLFSPRVFYIDQVPTRVLLPETLLIAGFALICSMTAAFLASRHVANIKPQEILRAA